MLFEMHAFLQTDSISITVSFQLHFVSVNMMVNAKERRDLVLEEVQAHTSVSVVRSFLRPGLGDVYLM